MNAKVAISSLSTSPDQSLVVLSGRIVASMTANAIYPAPFPTLAVVTAARNSYVSAVNGLDRGANSIALRDNTRLALVQALRELALYVQHASQGNLVDLLSSGFPAQKSRGIPVGLLPAPQNVRVRRTRSATQLLALCNAVPSAGSYQWRFATAQAPTVWTQPDPISKSRFILENLVVGTQYIVQVRAFGTSGPSDWSDIATMMAA